MSVLKAAEQVLSDAGEPLHYEEITRRILEDRLWQTNGKTPSATVNAQLGTSVKKKRNRSPFQRTAPGIFALRAWGVPEHPAQRHGRAPKPRMQRRDDEHLSFTEATERVLEQYGNRKPMYYRNIAAKALELGLVKTSGKTPEATFYAQVIQEIQRRNKRGDRPRFVMHGRGFIGLSKWLRTGLAFQIEQHNKQVRQKLHTHVRAMQPADFEELIGVLLAKLGFADIEVTGRTGDGGIDVRGTLVIGDVIRTRMAVQVKRWKHNVQSPVVQQVRGSLGTHEQGLIITTSNFSKGAREEAERRDATPVGLMDGDQLVKLLVEHDICIRREAHDLLELDADDSAGE